MTDIETGEAARRPSLTRMTQIGAAAVSLALIVGIGLWGYRLVVRDVQGVPVVQAADGSSRVQPEDPGGRLAAHQGLAVNEVAATGTSAPPPETVRLASAPVALTPEDLAQARLAALEEKEAPRAPREEAPGAALRALADGIAAQGTPFVTAADHGEAGAAARQPVTSVEETAAPATEDAPEAADTAQAVAETVAADAQSAAVPASAGVPERSLRPRVRPAALRIAARTPAAAAVPSASAVPETDAESLPAGTRLVQLGAFESAEIAREEWARLDTRFAAYLDGKTRVVQRAESGGRSFWRLRATGFEDLADARRFCAALTAEGADCIPVVTR